MAEADPVSKKRKAGSLTEQTAEDIFSQVNKLQANEFAYLERLLLPEQLQPLLVHFENSRKEIEVALKEHITEDVSHEEDLLSMDFEVVKAKTVTKVTEMLTPTVIQKIMELLLSKDRALQLEGVKQISAMLKLMEVHEKLLDRLPVAELFLKLFETIKQAKMVPFLIEFLKATDMEPLQLEALKCLTLFAPGPRIPFTPRDSPYHPSNMEFQGMILVGGAVPILIELLQSPNFDVRIAVLDCFNSLAKYSSEVRDYVLQAGVLGPLLDLHDAHDKVNLITHASAFLKTLSKSTHLQQAYSVVLPKLQNVLHKVNNDAVIGNVLGVLSTGNFSAAIDPVLCVKIVELLAHSSASVQKAALNSVNEIFVSGNQGLISILVDRGSLPHLLECLESKNDSVILKACKTVSTVFQIPECIPHIINANFLQPLVDLCVEQNRMPTRASAVEALMYFSRAPASQMRVLCVEQFVTLMAQLLERWKSYATHNKPALLELTFARNILELLDNILNVDVQDPPLQHSGSFPQSPIKEPLSPSKSFLSGGGQSCICFNRQTCDRLLVMFLQFAHTQEAEAQLYCEEFRHKLYAMFRNIQMGYEKLENTEVASRLKSIMQTCMDDVVWRSVLTKSSGPDSMDPSFHTKIPIKTYKNNDNRSFDVPRSMSFYELRKIVEDKYHVPHVVLQYQDEEGDIITLASQPAWEKAIQRLEKMLRPNPTLFGERAPTPQNISLKLLVREATGPVGTPFRSSTPTVVMDSTERNQSDLNALYEMLLQETKFSREELAQLLEFWNSRSTDGRISKRELEEGLRVYAQVTDPMLIEQTYQAFDVDGDGSIEIREVVLGISKLQHGTLDERLALSFRAYDTDRSGYITKDEVKAIFHKEMKKQAAGGVIDDEMLDASVDHLFEIVDKNHDGKLSFDEFKQGVLNGNITGVFGVGGV